MSRPSATIHLGDTERVVLNFVANVVRRCGDCRTVLLAVEAPQHIRRHCEMIETLGLDRYEEMTPEQSGRALLSGLRSGQRDTYELGFEEARYLLGVVERRLRYSDAYWALVPMLVDLKAALDVSFFRERWDDMARKTVHLGFRERETIVRCLRNPAVCLSCGIPTDGPANIVELQRAGRMFEGFALRTVVTVEPEDREVAEAADPVHYAIEEPVLAFTRDLVEKRAPLFPGGPRLVGKLLTKLENATPVPEVAPALASV